jgi:acyl-CoA thioesterase-2
VSLERVRLAVGVEEDGDRWVGRTDLSGVEGGGRYGGQLIAQALSAAARSAPVGSVPDSIHAHLVGASSAGPPVIYEVEQVRDGRALQHLIVRGVQAGRLVLVATVVSAFPVDGADWQRSSLPHVGPPDHRLGAEPVNVAFLGWGVFEMLRPMGQEGAVVPPLPFWIRAFDEVPDDPWLRGAVYAFWSDLGLNGDARSIHEVVAGPTGSTTAMHAVWLHRDRPPHEWHLFDVVTQSLAGNQGYVQASLFHGSSGQLVASAAQTVFIRGRV